MASPNITLILEGMILLFFEGEDVDNGTAKSCQVGILRHAPGHIFEIRVTKLGSPPEVTVYEEEDIRFTLALKVQNATNTNIDYRDWVPASTFDRLKSDAPDESFNWVLDLERDIYPDVTGGIGAKRKRFRSVLSLDTGTFFTAVDQITGDSGVSSNHLLTCDEHDNPKKVIGKVATRVGVDITLDTAAGGKATFLNGPEVLFEAESDDQYLVMVNRIRPHERESPAHHPPGTTPAASHHNRDANNFYDAIGHELDPEQMVYFVSTMLDADLPPAAPEAACLVAKMGISDISH